MGWGGTMVIAKRWRTTREVGARLAKIGGGWVGEYFFFFPSENESEDQHCKWLVVERERNRELGARTTSNSRQQQQQQQVGPKRVDS